MESKVPPPPGPPPGGGGGNPPPKKVGGPSAPPIPPAGGVPFPKPAVPMQQALSQKSAQKMPSSVAAAGQRAGAPSGSSATTNNERAISHLHPPPGGTMKSPAASWGSSMEPKPPPPPAFAGAPPPVPLPAANTQGGLVPAKRPTAAKKPPGGGGVPGSGAFGAPAMGNGASSKPFVPLPAGRLLPAGSGPPAAFPKANLAAKATTTGAPNNKTDAKKKPAMGASSVVNPNPFIPGKSLPLTAKQKSDAGFKTIMPPPAGKLVGNMMPMQTTATASSGKDAQTKKKQINASVANNANSATASGKKPPKKKATASSGANKVAKGKGTGSATTTALPTKLTNLPPNLTGDGKTNKAGASAKKGPAGGGAKGMAKSFVPGGGGKGPPPGVAGNGGAPSSSSAQNATNAARAGAAGSDGAQRKPPPAAASSNTPVASPGSNSAAGLEASAAGGGGDGGDAANLWNSTGRELKVEDALLYLDQVKLEFGDRPRIYNEFLEIMKNFKAQEVDTIGVINRVRRLFHGYNNLILGFNTFLPEGYKIEMRDLEPVFVGPGLPGTNQTPGFKPPPGPGGRVSARPDVAWCLEGG
eukprot:CAMPEP_0181086602 /NCGR_PEP_ID=MMETSP1071-20121207/5835_1 /TAXON_ID=35127 /ORGANISM="Thalassiosira sp., Strain NH16" /LENGTH=583 /DNA_ID=CAMNT_0023168451 /DNA_START=248 /DNA_END=1996 /DNA_ORIENTATION=-